MLIPGGVHHFGEPAIVTYILDAYFQDLVVVILFVAYSVLGKLCSVRESVIDLVNDGLLPRIAKISVNGNLGFR